MITQDFITVLRLTGTGPRFTKAGKRVLYRIDELDTWTASRTFTSTAEAQTEDK